MNPLAISPAFTSKIEISQDALDQRDEIITTSKQITCVSSQEELERAVNVLRDLSALEKITESGREKEKRPYLHFGKLIDSFANKFVASVVAEKARITQYVNEWQRKEVTRKQEEARKVESEKRKAEQEAAEAQRKIEEQQREIERQKLAAEQAKTTAARKKAADALAAAEAEKLKQQLAAEEVSMLKQSLSVVAPSNTPVGLATRVSYDFEIVDPRKLIATHPLLFVWKPSEEAFRFQRQFFRAKLNAETLNEYTAWRPPEDTQSVVMSDYGIRILVSVKTNVRN